MNSLEISRRLESARQFAVQAGQQTLELFQSERLNVEKKQDKSPVTEADRNAELFLRKVIEREFPADGIVGEEFEEKPGQSPARWILDPIDGTKSFICGVPLYGTMVGVEVEGRPTIGVVYIPGQDEGIFAMTGGGAWHFKGKRPPQPALVSSVDKLENAVLLTSESETFADRDAGEVYQRLADQVYFSRTWGDCYGYLLVATGRADIMIDPLLNIWDAAAVSPIITEAGGAFVDWAGESRIDAGESVGANQLLLEQVLEITRPFAGNFK